MSKKNWPFDEKTRIFRIDLSIGSRRENATCLRFPFSRSKIIA